MAVRHHQPTAPRCQRWVADQGSHQPTAPRCQRWVAVRLHQPTAPRCQRWVADQGSDQPLAPRCQQRGSHQSLRWRRLDRTRKQVKHTSLMWSLSHHTPQVKRYVFLHGPNMTISWSLTHCCCCCKLVWSPDWCGPWCGVAMVSNLGFGSPRT